MELTLFIVDDHEIVREGIRSLIANLRPNWRIIGEASAGQEAVAAILRLKPDVVLLDITMPDMSGLEVGRRLHEIGLATRLLFFTMHDSQSLADDVRGAYGHGYVLKSEAAHSLVRALETIHGGGTFFGAPGDSGTNSGKKFNLGLLFRQRIGFSPA